LITTKGTLLVKNEVAVRVGHEKIVIKDVIVILVHEEVIVVVVVVVIGVAIASTTTIASWQVALISIAIRSTLAQSGTLII